MSQMVSTRKLSFKAGADLSNNIYYLVKLDASGNVVLATDNAPVIGVLHNKPKSGETASVCIGETSKVVAGGDVVIGDELISDANGKAVKVPATAGEYNIIGIALENGSDGTVIEVLLRPYTKTVA